MTKIDSNKPTTDSEQTDEASENKKTGRRLQDSITSKDPQRKLNLDRRVARSDRRLSTDNNYNGPARRYTIDRRLKSKDRRS